MVRDFIRQMRRESNVDILCGVLSGEHVHAFVSVPPKLSNSDLMHKMKGWSSHKAQRGLPAISNRYRGYLR